MYCVSTVTARVCLDAAATPERDPRAGTPNPGVRLGVVAAIRGAARDPHFRAAYDSPAGTVVKVERGAE